MEFSLLEPFVLGCPLRFWLSHVLSGSLLMRAAGSPPVVEGAMDATHATARAGSSATCTGPQLSCPWAVGQHHGGAPIGILVQLSTHVRSPGPALTCTPDARWRGAVLDRTCAAPGLAPCCCVHYISGSSASVARQNGPLMVNGITGTVESWEGAREREGW